jgi:nitrate/nitrite transporter NarK
MMKRTSSVGLLVFGIVLGVAGAILRFAVEVTAEGFDIHTAGVILLVVGIGVAVVALILLAVGGRSRSTITESTRDTPTGQVRTEERSDSGPDG